MHVRLARIIRRSSAPLSHSASKTRVNALVIAAPEVIDARETAELEFELVRLLRIVRVNRHAETEE